jgi:hypothetical protein
LVRRRCKYIIACDATGDGQYRLRGPRRCHSKMPR